MIIAYVKKYKKNIKLNKCLFLGYDCKKTSLINFLKLKKLR